MNQISHAIKTGLILIIIPMKLILMNFVPKINTKSAHTKNSFVALTRMADRNIEIYTLQSNQ